MKYLSCLLLMGACVSCGNNKGAIVDRIKTAKDSFNLARNTESFYSLLGSEIRQYGKPMYSDKRFLKDVPQYVIDQDKTDSARIFWMSKKNKWQSVIDSLELELKK